MGLIDGTDYPHSTPNPNYPYSDRLDPELDPVTAIGRNKNFGYHGGTVDGFDVKYLREFPLPKTLDPRRDLMIRATTNF